VTVWSDPPGAAVESHDAAPADRVPLHRVVAPMVKVTDPVGVVPDPLTVAE
jgi:hypothetical protein